LPKLGWLRQVSKPESFSKVIDTNPKWKRPMILAKKDQVGIIAQQKNRVAPKETVMDIIRFHPK
jgi:hypothetical protein